MPSDTTPILDALSYLPREGDFLEFRFTDWAALKSLRGGDHITSASPLEERQHLLLEIAHAETSTISLGLDRLTDWSLHWGWDNTDLAWEATQDSWFDRILRFREDWNPTPFVARLEEDGYSRRENAHGIVFTPDPDTATPADDPLERVLGWRREVPAQPLIDDPVSVAIATDGRTVAISRADRAYEMLETAARTDPAALPDSPFGRVAAALGRPVTAIIRDGKYGCSGTGEENATLTGAAAALAGAVGPPHPYRAFGTGYERAGPGEVAVGRYVFAYETATQASVDLPGRRTLIDEGYSSSDGRRYRDAAFTLTDAVADGRELILDVEPVHGLPEVLFDVHLDRPVTFAICG